MMNNSCPCYLSSKATVSILNVGSPRARYELHGSITFNDVDALCSNCDIVLDAEACWRRGVYESALSEVGKALVELNVGGKG